ncbi:MAG TPA: hypothetical protein PLB18_24850, partial [Acidobacteriota bacterium]|nr:hypothetical protein [Acidobacteriota bacterium]
MTDERYLYLSMSDRADHFFGILPQVCGNPADNHFKKKKSAPVLREGERYVRWEKGNFSLPANDQSGVKP